MLEDRTTPTAVVTIVNGSDAFEGLSNGSFILTRTGDTSQSLYVSVNLSGAGTATPGQDFAYITSYAEFAPGSSTATVTVDVIGSPYDDGIVDPDETVILSIAGPGQYYSIGSPSSATVTIHEPPAVSVVAANDSAEGGTDGTFVFSRTGDTSQSLTVGYGVSGTATNGVDYPLLSGSVTIPAGDSAVNVLIDGYHDGHIEDDETVTLAVSPGGNYQVDEDNGSATLTVIDTDLDPGAFDGWFSSSIGMPIAIAALDLTFDANDDPRQLTTVTQGENGTVAISQGGVTYTPNAGFTGDDSFTYTVEDQFGNNATGTISVTIFDLQAAPTSVWTALNTAITVDVPGMAFDTDGQTLSTSAVTQGAHGGVVINGDGTVTYTPNSSFTGDDQFDYTVGDPDGHTATQTITVTVGVAGPVALDNDAITDVNTAVTVRVADGAFDPAGGSVTVTAVTQGAHGSVALNQDGTVTYTPANGYEGNDSFTYTVTDGGSNPATGTVKVTVGTPAPTAGDLIIEDLDGIDSEIASYDQNTPDTTTAGSILADLPGITTNIDSYLDEVTTYISTNSIESGGSVSKTQLITYANDYMDLYDRYSKLLAQESTLSSALTANKLLILSLRQALNAAANAPNPDRNLIHALSQIERQLFQVQIGLARIEGAVLRELNVAYKAVYSSRVAFWVALPPSPIIVRLPWPSAPPVRNPFDFVPRS